MIKFTIGTASNDLRFEETMRLIKSSLLYADEIELLGLLEFTFFCYLPRRLDHSNNIEQLLNIITPCLKNMDIDGGKELLAQIEEISTQLDAYAPILKKKKRRTRQEILAQAQMNKIFSQSYKEIEEQIQAFLDNSGAQAIKTLVDQKIITVHDYSYSDYELNELVGGYFGNLLNIMQNSASYPLFDSVSENVIRSVSNTKILDIGRIKGEVLRHAGVASKILMTLPSLNSADIDEILSFKKENEGPLLNFRKAIFNFSERITSLPWDEDFQYEIIKLYSTDVAPKVEELNTLTSETSTLRNFSAKVLEDEECRKAAGWLAGGIATTIVTQNGLVEALGAFQNMLLSLSLLTVSPQIAKGFMKSVSLFNKSRKEVRERQNEMKGNTMYYYYKAMNELR